MAMGLKTSSSDGDFLPRIQYDARAGRFFKVDRVQDDAGNWVNDMEEMALPIRIAIDMENLEVGWIRLDTQVDFQMVRVHEDLPRQPSDHHKQGFRATIYNKALGVRHWNHTAKCVISQFDAIHTQWERDRSEHRGEIPVIEIQRVTAIVTGTGERKSTNYAPDMVINQWIERPGILDASPGETSSDVPPPAEQVPAPQAATTNGSAQPAAGQEF